MCRNSRHKVNSGSRLADRHIEVARWFCGRHRSQRLSMSPQTTGKAIRTVARYVLLLAVMGYNGMLDLNTAVVLRLLPPAMTVGLDPRSGTAFATLHASLVDGLRSG